MSQWTFAHSQLVTIAKETASIYSLSLLHTFEAKPRITQVLSNFYEEHTASELWEQMLSKILLKKQWQN